MASVLVTSLVDRGEKYGLDHSGTTFWPQDSQASIFHVSTFFFYRTFDLMGSC